MLRTNALSTLIRTSTTSSSSSSRLFSTTRAPRADFTHAIIGGGVVGLAIARQLQSRPGASSALIEQHPAVGTETSSRNSEVVHAGIYYGADSLKTRLCIRGKALLYDVVERNGIGYRRTGKWLVAQDEEEYKALERVHEHARTVGVETRWVSGEEATRREPHVRAEAGVLESPTTGIVDSHGLMTYLQGDFEERGGIVALGSKVERVVPVRGGAGGWEIYTAADDGTGGGAGEESVITADTVINAAGLYAIPLSNTILPSDRHIEPFYTKGTYFSYSLSQPKTNTLIYPAPVPGHAGLGTHLTLDLSGRLRFGPDVQPTSSPRDYTPSDAHFDEAVAEIRKYLPGIDVSALGLDYCGIRPKLSAMSSVTSGKGFQDFWIRREEGFEGFVNLLGIESPGLTSSLAIAEEVEGLLYR